MNRKNPTICLLGASFGTSNMGVNALATGTLKAFFHQFPDGELFLLDYGKERVTHQIQLGGRIIPVQLVNIRFSKKFYLKNNIAWLILLAMLSRCIPFHRIRKRLVSKNNSLSCLADADIVVSMAGGDSFSDIYGFSRFLYVSLPQLLALLLGKSLVLLPQTLGPFRSWITGKMAKYIMAKAEAVYSRDSSGVEETKKMLGLPGSSKKVRFCYDVGFILDPVKPRQVNAGCPPDDMRSASPVVGLNVSGLLYRGGYDGNNMFGLKMDYKELILDLIDFMIRKKDATVMLVPHVFGSDGESDSVVCEQIYAFKKERYDGRLLYAGGDHNQSEIKYLIGRCDFFVGSRMHACIAALSQNVPTISIAYSSKFIGVMESIGVAGLVADPRQLEKEEILKSVNVAFEQRTELRGHLEKTMPQVKERVLRLFDEICSLPA